MKKRLAVCAAAALAASLTLGSLSTAYAATEMTLAGFGAEVKKEDTKAETEKKEEAQPKETEVKKTETELKFMLNGNSYTLKLTKHRVKEAT